MYSIYIVHSRYEAEPLIYKDLQRNCAHDRITSHRWCSADRQLLKPLCCVLCCVVMRTRFFCSFLYSLNRFDVAVRLHCRLCGHILFLSLLYQLSSLFCFVGMWWHCGCLCCFCCCCGFRVSFVSSIFTLTKPIGCSAFINDINGGKTANKIYYIDDCKLLLHPACSITTEPCWTLTLFILFALCHVKNYVQCSLSYFHPSTKSNFEMLH